MIPSSFTNSGGTILIQSQSTHQLTLALGDLISPFLDIRGCKRKQIATLPAPTHSRPPLTRAEVRHDRFHIHNFTNHHQSPPDLLSFNGISCAVEPSMASSLPQHVDTVIIGTLLIRHHYLAYSVLIFPRQRAIRTYPILHSSWPYSLLRRGPP